MERRRKKIRVLSSSESDSSPEDMEDIEAYISGYASEGNSSVESVEIIMSPSASVLNKLKSNSKESKKECNKEKIKDILQKSLTRKSTKPEVTAKQPKSKKTSRKKVKKLSTGLSKISTVSNKLSHKNEGQCKIVNHANVTSDKVKNPNIKLGIIPNFPKSSATSNDNHLVCKKPRFSQSVPNNEEKLLSNEFEDRNKATCSYFPNAEKTPSTNIKKIPTVKRRPENYGSRLNNMLPDLLSDSTNTIRTPKRKRPVKPKDLGQNKCKENEKNEVNYQITKSQPAKNHSCTRSLPKIGNKEQSSTELLSSKNLKADDKLGRCSSSDHLPKIRKKNNSTSNLENFSYERANYDYETVSGPCNSLESLCNNLSESDEINKNIILDLIKTIVDLDTKWLEEKEKNTVPPPNLLDDKRVTILPIFFESFEDYYHQNLSMLKVEIWERICSRAKSNLSHTKKNNFTFSIDSHEYDLKLMRLYCKSAVHGPAENSLVIVKLKLQDGQIKSTFGFIEDISEANEGHERKLNFKMLVKSRKIIPLKDCQMEGKFVCSLYKETKQAEALCLMKFSPLLKDFITPTLKTFFTLYNQCYKNDFFNIQQNITDAVSEEINLFPSEPRIMLLQGPPGSGKTSYIVSVAFNLLRDKEDVKKILLVAPCYFALDEIANQLLEFNESFANNPINFVRLGQIEKIHHKILDCSLHRKLEKWRMSFEQNYRSLNSNLKAVKEVSRSSINTGKSPCNEKSKYLAEQCETIKYKDLEEQQIGKILSDTSLILAVPEDCWVLRKFKVKFSCCLMDEVNQGTELETLYPFALGISKFLLVADPMQLPATVESETARKYGYQRSVMERFQSYFEKIKGKNPTAFLSQQYRINSHTANFPFKHFYFHYRVNCSFADQRSAFYPLKPYIVVDDQRQYGTKELPYTEDTGVNLVSWLCSFIIDKHPTSSIGIIVPSEEDQKAYKAIPRFFPSSDIEVQTVDHFQGREKTVIILSLYHDSQKDVPFRTDYFRDERKLNVALTRAISSLIICGPLHKHMKYDIWPEIVTDCKNRSCYFQFKSLDEIQPSRLLMKV